MALDDYEIEAMTKQVTKLKQKLSQSPYRKHIIWCDNEEIARFVCSRVTPTERAQIQLQVASNMEKGSMQYYYIYDEAHVGEEV